MATHVSVKDITVGQKLKFSSKNDPSVKFKAEVEEIFVKDKKAKLLVLEGSNEGKSFTIPEDRIFRNQGRQPGTSPVKAKAATTATIVKDKKTGKPTSKTPPKKTEVEEDMDPDSAAQELIDISEDLTDIVARIAAIQNFLSQIEVKEATDSPDEDEGEEDASPSPSPAPKKRTRSRKPMNDSDEE